jgi:hypothetical protein
MATALIHLDPKQKARLTRRAKKVGRSFSQEVRNAVDLYLEIPVETEEELRLLARAANDSARRSIKRLDETIAYVDAILKSMRRSKGVGPVRRLRPCGKLSSSISALII